MSSALRALPGRMTAAIVAGSVRHAWLTLVTALLVTAAALHYTVHHLAIDTDTSNMLDPRLPHRQAHRAFRAAFPDLPGEVVVFTEAADAGAAEDAADALAAQIAARPDIARVVERPGGDAYFRTHGLLYLDTEALWQLDERLQAAEPMLGTLAHDPSLRGLFATFARGLDHTLDDAQQRLLGRMFERVSAAITRLDAGAAGPVRWRDELFERKPDQGLSRAFILIVPARDASQFPPTAAAVTALRELLAEATPTFPGVAVRVTGAAVMDGEELETVAEDAKLTTSLSFLLVAVVLAIGLRAPSLVFAVLITLACGLVLTAAFATVAVGALNIISVCFAVLFIGMGVDFGIQFTMRYLEETDRGEACTHALVEAARGAGGALALAAVGAAISFLAFVPTSYRGLAQLGVISGFGMLVAWLANITVLPALLRYLPVPRPRPARATPARGTAPQWIQRHARSVLVVTAVGILAAALVSPALQFDLNPLNLKDGRTEGVAAYRRLAEDPASSPYTIQVLTPSLAAAEALAGRLAELPEVDTTLTLGSFVPADQDEKLAIIEGLRFALAGALETDAATPPPSVAEEAASVREFNATLAAQPRDRFNPEFAARLTRLHDQLQRLTNHPDGLESQVTALRTVLIGDLPAMLARLGQLLDAAPVTLETLPESLRKTYVAADGRARVQVMPKANLNDNDAMRAFVRAVQRVAPDATDAPVELYEGSRAVIEACITASLWALGLTLILHIVVLHGVVDALLVAAPLVLAMLLTVATSVLFDFPFNFANIIALPLLIGLNNAYGAYLVVRRHHADNVDGLLASSTPRAILFSGMTTIASFGVLGVSKHPGMAGMGVLICVSLTYAILSALFVLPALMTLLESRTAKEA